MLSFNPFEESYRTNPYPTLRRLREESPIFESPFGFFLCTRFDDVQRVLKSESFALSHDAGSSRFTPGSAIGRVCSDAFLFRNPPDHTRLRAVVGRWFSPGRVRKLRSQMQHASEALACDIEDNASVDLVERFCVPAPLLTICNVMGIDESDRVKVGDWSAALCPTLDPVVSDETVRALDEAVTGFEEFLMIYARRRVEEPKDDLLTALAKAWSEGEISGGELVATGVLLLTAGHETSSNLIASGIVSLLNSPEQLRVLRQDLSLLPFAVEEMMRMESPIQMYMRWAMEDCVVGGRSLKAGDQVALHIGAANRDPAVFGDPDVFRVEREGNRHIAFGSGIHACVGAALARAEAESAVCALLQEFRSISLLDSPQWKDTVTVRGPRSLRVSVKR